MSSVGAFSALIGASLAATVANCWHLAEMMMLAAIIVGAAHGLHHVWSQRIV